MRAFGLLRMPELRLAFCEWRKVVVLGEGWKVLLGYWAGYRPNQSRMGADEESLWEG